MIVAAAIQYGPLVCFVPPPGRHHNVMHAIHALAKGGRSDKSYEVEVQGFITRMGVFLNRREAYVHAAACGQISPTWRGPYYDGNELYSEDLW